MAGELDPSSVGLEDTGGDEEVVGVALSGDPSGALVGADLQGLGAAGGVLDGGGEPVLGGSTFREVSILSQTSCWVAPFNHVPCMWMLRGEVMGHLTNSHWMPSTPPAERPPVSLDQVAGVMSRWFLSPSVLLVTCWGLG